MLGTDLLCFLDAKNVFEALLKDVAANDRAILRPFKPCASTDEQKEKLRSSIACCLSKR